MTTMDAPRKRLSLHLGPALTGLLDTGQCSGSGLSQRLETLAQRYLALVGTPPTWPLASWGHVIRAAQRIDLTAPAATWSLIGLIRAERLDSKLTYALDAIPPAQTFAVLSVAERFIATGREPVDADIGEFLIAAGIAVSPQ